MAALEALLGRSRAGTRGSAPFIAPVIEQAFGLSRGLRAVVSGEAGHNRSAGDGRVAWRAYGASLEPVPSEPGGSSVSLESSSADAAGSGAGGNGTSGPGAGSPRTAASSAAPALAGGGPPPF